MSLRGAAVAALSAALWGCGPPDPAAGGETFLAFPSDFKSYRSWESHQLQSAPVEGQVHAAGDRTVYLNRRPAAHADAFPVGTLIVKEVPGAQKVFAMAKRGGGYNRGGAEGWE